jgi:hypothetical protein
MRFYDLCRSWRNRIQVMHSYFDDKTKKLFTCDVCWVVETEGFGVLHHVRIRGYARQSKEIS